MIDCRNFWGIKGLFLAVFSTFIARYIHKLFVIILLCLYCKLPNKQEERYSTCSVFSFFIVLFIVHFWNWYFVHKSLQSADWQAKSCETYFATSQIRLFEISNDLNNGNEIELIKSSLSSFSLDPSLFVSSESSPGCLPCFAD